MKIYMKNMRKYIESPTFPSWHHTLLLLCAFYVPSPFTLVPLSLCRNMSLPLLFCHALYPYLWLSVSTSSFVKHCIYAPPSHWTSTEAKTFSLLLKIKCSLPFLCSFSGVTPLILSVSAESLLTLPACLPPSLLPPPLPPLTSPPSLQHSFSPFELTLSLAFVLTGQSPRAECRHHYLICHLLLSFVSVHISTAIHPFISVQPQG